VRTSSVTETEGPLPSLRDHTGPHVEYPYRVYIKSILMVFYPSAFFSSGLLPLPGIEELFVHQFRLLDVAVCGRGACNFWGLFIHLMACILCDCECWIEKHVEWSDHGGTEEDDENHLNILSPWWIRTGTFWIRAGRHNRVLNNDRCDVVKSHVIVLLSDRTMALKSLVSEGHTIYLSLSVHSNVIVQRFIWKYVARTNYNPHLQEKERGCNSDL